MSVIGSNILAGASGQGGGGYNLTRSLRFRSSASAYLNRTPSSAGNRQIWTYSDWVKRGSLGVGFIFFANTVAPSFGLFFTSGNQIRLFHANGAGYDFDLTTNAVFRDPSAWYHIVLSIDTTQATNTNRIKLYVNNVLQTFTGSSYPTQNLNTTVNNTVLHEIGRSSDNNANYFDGYLTEVNFIDGQALTPSSFGETNAKTGVWQPKRYAGTYGTNGFYLPFTDNSALTTSSNVGLGKDFSGNGNYWTTNNISITSGATYDSMTDVPTLTSATASNFCVLNPLAVASAFSLSNANLNLSGTSSISGVSYVKSTLGVSSGKWYWEMTPTDVGGGLNYATGIVNSNSSVTSTGTINLVSDGYVYHSDGNKYSGGTSSAYGASYTNNDVIGVALDLDAGTLTFYKNNTSQGTAYTGLSGTFSPLTTLHTGGVSRSIAGNANFGQRPFAYTPPTGFVALNTFNLPTPTIGATASTQANKYMDVSLYTGNGSTQSVTNSGSMQPDLVWIKGKNYAQFHDLADSVRGGTKVLSSNSTAAEVTDANNITSFNSNGFTLGSSAYSNTDTSTFVAWQWRASNTTPVTNTAGSITSTVSANTTSGFSVVTYTGTGANATVGHGLGVAPKFIIFKNRLSSPRNWICYHANLTSANYFLELNTTAAQQSDSTQFNNTAPTSTVFSVGSSTNTNQNTNGQVAYCFSAVAGYSAFGSYVGNGSADGSFIHVGFKPRFVMIKRTDSGNNWFILDTARDTANLANDQLLPNSSAAESTGSDCNIDILSNGFKLRTALDASNGSGGTYIYACFAEHPFKYSLGR